MYRGSMTGRPGRWGEDPDAIRPKVTIWGGWTAPKVYGLIGLGMMAFYVLFVR
jgi:hypothetical protein